MKKKCLVRTTTLLLLLVLTTVNAWTAEGDTYVVDANGGGQYTSISAAVSAATGGETILIKDGTLKLQRLISVPSS